MLDVVQVLHGSEHSIHTLSPPVVVDGKYGLEQLLTHSLVARFK